MELSTACKDGILRRWGETLDRDEELAAQGSLLQRFGNTDVQLGEGRPGDDDDDIIGDDDEDEDEESRQAGGSGPGASKRQEQ